MLKSKKPDSSSYYVIAEALLTLSLKPVNVITSLRFFFIISASSRNAEMIEKTMLRTANLNSRIRFASYFMNEDSVAARRVFFYLNFFFHCCTCAYFLVFRTVLRSALLTDLPTLFSKLCFSFYSKTLLYKFLGISYSPS